MKNITFRNKTEFNNKLKAIKKDGASKLHLLADFDRTLTKSFINGEQRPSLIGAMRKGGFLGEEYSKKAYELFDKYHPIEIDPDLDMDTKKMKMTEWWEKHLALLVDSKLHSSHIDKVINSGIIEFRDGIRKFINYLEFNSIPLVIISANGLGGDSINLYFNKHELLKDNIYVISNQFIWDDDGVAVGYKDPLIHVFNKDETVLKDFPELNNKLSDRKNVILMGDSLGDPHMVDGFDFDNLICIGYLNDKEDELMEEYLKRYDVVITGDTDLEFVNNLLNNL